MSIVLKVKDLLTVSPDEREWYQKEKELRRRYREAQLEAKRRKVETRGAVAEAKVRRYEAKTDAELKRLEEKLQGVSAWQNMKGILMVSGGVVLAFAVFRFLYPKISAAVRGVTGVGTTTTTTTTVSKDKTSN